MSSTTSPTASISASASSGGGHGLELGDKNNTTFKIVGICLAIGSGIFIGTSFVVKKKGLLSATRKYGNKTGEGHAYLKNWIWWTGMIMMVIGEILNFVAYAFTEAILVTPMGALSVVISAILSHFFLSESLTFFGWIGCILCILGATILALNAPEQQSVTTIEGFKHLFIAPGFLVWMSICILASLGIKFFVVPKWGRTSMLPFVGICSMIGGISVSCTQGVGASIVTSIGGDNQVKNWFFWFILIFVVITLLIEINYLNKALEIFNTALVVPVYFVLFTTCVLITSFILYQGLKASAVVLITMVLGFLVICLGITLLQMSKVDPSNFKLDRRTTILLQTTRDHPKETASAAESEKGEVLQYEDPGMDALRGGFGAVGSIIRARSVSRRMSRSASMGGRWYDEAYDPKGMQRVGSVAYGGSKEGLNTMGMENLRRYQLNDAPMPEDAAARIAYHRSPTASSVNSFPTVDAVSRPHLKFGEQDMVHQYDPASARHFSSALPHDQLHVNTQNLHAIPPHLAGHRQPSYGPSSPSIKRNPSVFTVPESPDEYNYTLGTAERVHPGHSPDQSYEQGSTRYSVAPDQGSYGAGQAYSDPYANLRAADAAPPSPGGRPRRKSSAGASNLFHDGGFVRSLGSIFNFQPNPDLSLRPQPAPSPRSASPGHMHKASDDAAAPGETGSRRASDNNKDRTKLAKGAEEEERRGLVEAGRMSEEAADIGYGNRRVMGPRAPVDKTMVDSNEKDKGGLRGEKGLTRVETVLSQDRDHESSMSSPEEGPVRPARSGF